MCVCLGGGGGGKRSCRAPIIPLTTAVRSCDDYFIALQIHHFRILVIGLEKANAGSLPMQLHSTLVHDILQREPTCMTLTELM